MGRLPRLVDDHGNDAGHDEAGCVVDGKRADPCAGEQAYDDAQQGIVLGGEGQRVDGVGVEAAVEDGDGRVRELGLVACGAAAGHHHQAEVADLQARHRPRRPRAGRDARAGKQSGELRGVAVEGHAVGDRGRGIGGDRAWTVVAGR